jgi:hypothetical protein
MPETSNALTQFRIERSDEGYQLHIEDDSGASVEFQVTRDQLDVICDHLDEILAEDDVAEASDDEDDEDFDQDEDEDEEEDEDADDDLEDEDLEEPDDDEFEEEEDEDEGEEEDEED